LITTGLPAKTGNSFNQANKQGCGSGFGIFAHPGPAPADTDWDTMKIRTLNANFLKSKLNVECTFWRKIKKSHFFPFPWI
jgi:hypothetical protein